MIQVGYEEEIIFVIMVKELPTFYNGMCYVIEYKHPFNANDVLPEMGVTIVKTNKDLDYVKLWLTTDYDYLASTHSLYGDFFPFKFDVRFDEKQKTKIMVVETSLRPLICNQLDIDYVSEQQCLVNHFVSEDFSPCPHKCIPVQMKGFHYFNILSDLTNCSKLEDETCNGGPKVWDPLEQAILQCLKPCQFTTYIESRLEKYEMTYLKPDPNEAYFELVLNHVRTVEKEVLVYDTNDMIAAIGGFLGLFLGFSFFGVISGCMEHFIQMVNHLNLIWTDIKLALSEVKK